MTWFGDKQSMEFQRIAPALSIILVSSLNIVSQVLFHYIEPAPLTRSQAIKFDILTAGLFICYFRTWLLDPGRIPRDWEEKNEQKSGPKEGEDADQRRRWCRKCEMPKPPRAHHCKSCKRCIPKMDHHCPWTANCVSHRTLPHFIRFLIYGASAASYLEYHLFIRLGILWTKRNLPSYLGPTATQLVLLFVLTLANTITLTGVGILLLRCIYSLALNTTTIESWEISRHETLLRRARHQGGYLDTPAGTRIKLVRQEFPYDVGLFANFAQAMHSRNPLVWIWPFASSAAVDEGLAWPENGFEEPGRWPPPDPDRGMWVPPRGEEGRVLDLDAEAVRRRQAADQGLVRRRKKFWVRLEERQRIEAEGAYEHGRGESSEEDVDEGSGGEEGWRNGEGERLADFGVDEDVEFYDEDDLPLAELMRRRAGKA